ncbi:MAG: preprotein translocase subunit SecA, partial [Sulfurovum sp.]|nr:preprotein translocase subunit SecA [Sulfurovum sp.]NNJ45765.1 preprotein translocase subunit SecA [Sulfurovum sp.]
MIKSVLKLFGTQNDKIVKNYLKKVKNINSLESQYEAMDDEALKAAFEALGTDVQNNTKTLDDVLYDSFAITREAAKRVLNMRHYDVQMVGGL